MAAVAQENDALQTRVAIMGDRVGAGKSYVILALLLQNDIRNSQVDVVRSFGFNTVKFQFQSGNVSIQTNLLVIPHNLVKQWTTYIADCDAIPDEDWDIIHRTKTLDKYLADETAIGSKKLLVITSTMYNRFANHMADIGVYFQRIIYDEVDSLNMPSGRYLNAKFYWLVTASFGNLLYPKGFTQWVREMHRYEWYASGIRCTGFIRTLLTELHNSIPHKLMRLIVLKNEEGYVEKSMSLPEIVTETIRCRTPAAINVLNGIVDKNIIDCLNANDLSGAIQYVNPVHRNTEECIVSIMVDKYQNNMHNYKLRHEAAAQMRYASTSEQQTELNRLERIIEELQAKIDAIKSRIETANMCPICYDTIQNKSIMKCCNNAYCFKCINMWLTKKASCPVCNNKLTQDDIYVVCDAVMAEEGAVLMDKYENLKILLCKLKEQNAKVLLFSAYDTSFYQAIPIMDDLGIKYEKLKGNGNQINCTMNRYKNEDVNLLAINSSFYGSGLNLENTTDIIMFHKFDSEVERQVIGRAQRLGRDRPLKRLKIEFIIYLSTYNTMYCNARMNFCFDTETTGLPGKAAFKKYGKTLYKNLEAYDTARIVSISWILSQNDKVVEQSYYVIRPEGFQISPESQAVHGITPEITMRDGKTFDEVLVEMERALRSCNALVAHNIKFDSNVLKAELWRRGKTELLDYVNGMHEICTMNKGKEVMKATRFPKLSALYKFLYDEELENAHNAMYDTWYCFQCYKKMFPVDNSLFFFGNKCVKLTAEQREIVYGDNDRHSLVIACAGSGKTTTTLCKIKWMIQQGVKESSIMLTTFTRDAANDMKVKLADIMGYVPVTTVGTIDSIARKYVEDAYPVKHLRDVGEYGHLFLRLLKKKPAITRRYEYLFVDEFQDINDVQFKIIHEFAKGGVAVFAVGDDAQNIYSFRGSNIQYILNFGQYFQDSCTYMLTANFRSTAAIVDLANACIEKNENQIPKTMIAGGGGDAAGHPKPLVAFFGNVIEQNYEIMRDVKRALAAGVDAHEIAILAPTNRSLYMVEELLTKEGIPNVYMDGRAEVKTCIKPHHVCLTTIHKAKGLEWHTVFMTQMSDEVLPMNKNALAVEEGRRLFYVGITRAKRALYIYYTVFNDKEPYVTRYISELERDLFGTRGMCDVHFGAGNKVDTAVMEMSVTRLLENLDGEDILHLREANILPSVEVGTMKREVLWEGYTYRDWIVDQDLYSDFGIFVEKLVMREIGRQRGALAADKHAVCCLANLKLDPDEYGIYSLYKDAFRRWVKPDYEMIDAGHVARVKSIFAKIEAVAKTYSIDPKKVAVFSQRFLPPGFEDRMQSSLKMYGLRSEDSAQPHIQESLWELAKCKKIVMEYRRRLLYKKIDMSCIEEYRDMYEDVVKKFVPWLGGNVVCEEDVGLADSVFGELDIRVGDHTIIDLKCSNQEDVTISWILQLLCYKALYDKNHGGYHIKKVGIMNILKGWYTELDVSEWKEHDALLAYLLKKREEKLDRLNKNT